MSSEGTSTTASSCDCQNCPLNIRILLDGKFDEFQAFLEYHAANYLELNASNNQTKNLHIEIIPKENLEQALQESPDEWDGALFPGQLIGSLVMPSMNSPAMGNDLLWDLTHFVRSSETLDWPDVLTFFRQPSSGFGSSTASDDDNDDSPSGTKLLPLDGDLLSLYYRRDLFDQFNRTVPRTWEEYSEAAAFFDGKPLGPGGSPLYGSCVSRIDKCGNEYWTALILASMTQIYGTSSGFFLDPATMEPLFGPAMDETLRLIREQLNYGHEDELTGECLASNFAFNQGNCALTYNWGNQITVSGSPFDIGVAPTPGSTRILDRESGELLDCTVELCPYGEFYEDIGVINRAPYAAFGGWSAGISNAASSPAQYATADFFAYVSNSMQSTGDVLPNPRSTFVQPYRQAHLRTAAWVDNGFDRDLASEYTAAVRQVQSENTVLELRVDSASDMRSVVDQEVFNYLLESFQDDRAIDDLPRRQQVTLRMEEGINTLVAMGDKGMAVKLSESYRASIGFSNVSEQELKNYINEDFRDAAWGLSGLMCFTALALLFWTVRHRNNKVMKAFQPFLLIQSSIGLVILSLSIIPLGFDDSGYDVDILNYTCMLAPVLYVVGFTIFFSSVYSKIRVCIEIYREPHNYDCLMVRPGSALRLCFRLLILNGTLLGLWAGLDPLTWERREVEGGLVLEDGTVETYGSCRGGYTALGFALSIYALNILMTLIASLQAFKCRFLVLEYNEMQWLPLSVFPFLEVWVIGGPILPLIYENPTVTFVVLSMVVVVSTVLGGMAVFAPKDWYIRKHYYHNQEPNKLFPERTSSAGVMVLKHPTVECQKEVDELGFKLDQVEGWNTELEIEIRVMKEKVKELSTSTKFQFRQSLLNSVMTDVDTPEERTSRGAEDYEPQELSRSAEDELAAVHKFEQVWQMPDEDDEEEARAEEELAKSGSLQSLLQEDTSSRGLGVQAAPGSGSDRGVGSEVSNTADVDDPLARIMRMEAGNKTASQRVRSAAREDDGPQDPLARLAMMDQDSDGDDGPSSRSLNAGGDDEDGPRDPLSRIASIDKKDKDEGESAQDIIARIIAMKMASTGDDEDGENHSTNSNPEDPLARLMSMESEDTHLSEDPDVPTMEYQYADDEGDEGEDVIIRKKDFRDLSSMIQENDLEELERRAALLAESVKTKLEDSNYADLSRDDNVSTDTGSGFGYSALARRRRDSDSQSKSMDGLDISKITTMDDGDKQFVSMSESILESPGRRSPPESNVQDARTTASSDGSTKSPSIHLSAGESSSDVLQKGLQSNFPSNRADDTEGYVAQIAGEPSEGESRLKTIGKPPLVASETVPAPSADEEIKSPVGISKPPLSMGSRAEESPVAAPKPYVISDWVAVGGLAGALAEWSDSQSTSSYAESIPDSVTSMEATTRASALETPVAKEIDKLVRQMDWDGVKKVATGYEPSRYPTQPAPANAPPPAEHNPSTLAEKRRKKRELEAWRSSLSKSFEKQM